MGEEEEKLGEEEDGEEEGHEVEDALSEAAAFSHLPNARPRPRLAARRVVYCYVEYQLSAPEVEAGPLSGSLVFSSGFEGDDSVRASSWLIAADLPHSQRVDRVFCCEFRTLTALCCLLAEHAQLQEDFEVEDLAEAALSRGRISGEAHLFTTGVSCVSCVGAMQQFRQLFPGISISIEMQEWWPHVDVDPLGRVLEGK